MINIKHKLKNLGFDENKLELAIGGVSSGAHLSLLYGYSMKNIPIPLKFLINIVGPLSLEIKYCIFQFTNVGLRDASFCTQLTLRHSCFYPQHLAE